MEWMISTLMAQSKNLIESLDWIKNSLNSDGFHLLWILAKITSKMMISGTIDDRTLFLLQNGIVSEHIDGLIKEFDWITGLDCKLAEFQYFPINFWVWLRNELFDDIPVSIIDRILFLLPNEMVSSTLMIHSKNLIASLYSMEKYLNFIVFRMLPYSG